MEGLASFTCRSTGSVREVKPGAGGNPNACDEARSAGSACLMSARSEDWFWEVDGTTDGEQLHAFYVIVRKITSPPSLAAMTHKGWCEGHVIRHPASLDFARLL